MISIKRNAGKFILVLLIGLIVQVLFDPLGSIGHTSQVVKARLLFPGARAKWDEQKMTDYSFETRGYTPHVCLVSALIEVRNGVVTQVKTMEFFPDDASTVLLPPEKWATPSPGGPIFLCDYADFTMPRFFDYLEQLLEINASAILHVDFDPDYGFITYFRFGSFVPQGRLSPRIGDCCSWFRIQNFQRLEVKPAP